MDRSPVTLSKTVLIATSAIVSGLMPSTALAVSCNVSTRPAAFGIYNPLQSTPLTTTGEINVACACTGILDCVAFGYRIEVSPGQSGNTAAREMRAGTGRLQYNLYSDAALRSVWGSGSASVSMLYLLTLFGSKQTLTVYARIPPGQVVPAGAYSDNAAVTILF